jgi:hypothetical protein
VFSACLAPLCALAQSLSALDRDLIAAAALLIVDAKR